MAQNKINTKYSFWGLLSEYIIQIPIIQRDYAQGRITEDVDTIRHGFLENLFIAISNNDSLDFDFIYGTIKGDNILEPLDGQQRLTTLFLLHWYLATREGKLDRLKPILKKFTYETRSSSREFCTDLIDRSIELPVFSNAVNADENISLSSVIIDCSWFFLSWKKDPTIQSMLVMLDAIHEKFYNTENLLDKLIAQDKPTVTFQFLNIDDNEFKLTDELYIKMNARGKPLTEFENFKAKYEQFLDKIDAKNKSEFSTNIDGIWTDYFWSYREDDVIDKPFMRFFYFITEMLYHSTKRSIGNLKLEYAGNVPKITFSIIESVYSNKKNINFLFDTINYLVSIVDTDAYFTQIFANSNYVSNKVSLFEDNVNLFKRCITGNNFTIKQKVLLFVLFHYWINAAKVTVSTNLTDYLRIIRNLVSRLRQLIQIEYEPNLRYENLSVIISGSLSLLSVNNVYQIIASKQSVDGFSKESLADEIEKANLINSNATFKSSLLALEDNILLQGSVHNIIKVASSNLLPNKITSFQEIWNVTDYSLIIRALLTVGDYSIEIGNSALGIRYFLGNSDYWYTVLSLKGSQSKNVEDKIEALIQKYQTTSGSNPTAKLKKIVSDWLSTNTVWNWEYYFIKYHQMSSNSLNLFAWKNDFEIRSLTGVNLVSYHINPYVKTVCLIINDKQICDVGSSYGRWSEESPLLLVNGVTLLSKEDGWWVITPDSFILKTNLIKKYSLKKFENSNIYLLTESANKDRIEIAVDFINNL